MMKNDARVGNTCSHLPNVNLRGSEVSSTPNDEIHVRVHPAAMRKDPSDLL